LTTKNIKKFPTNLVANWQSKISKTSDDAQLENHQRASSPLGGLEDDDARGERPNSIQVVNRYDEYKTRKNDVCFFFISGLIGLLIPSAGIKLIAVYDSDPDFIQYHKPKVKVKVGLFSNVNVCKGADT
jgi:hypothetical protein